MIAQGPPPSFQPDGQWGPRVRCGVIAADALVDRTCSSTQTEPPRDD